MDPEIMRIAIQGLSAMVEGNNFDAHPCKKNGDYYTHFTVRMGHAEVLRNYINSDLIRKNLNIKNVNTGETPLMCACALGNLEIVTLLCNHPDVDVNLDNGHQISRTKYAVSNAAPLHVACAHGHLDIVKYLVEEAKADINLTTDMGTTPLIYTVSGEEKTPTSKLIPIIDYLVSRPGIKLDVTSLQGHTFLSAAIQRGDYDLVDHICDSVFAYEIPHNMGMNALINAISTGKMDMVRHFVEKIKVDLNRAAPDTPTPLCHAITRNKYFIVDYLLKHGADSNFYSPKEDKAPPLVKAIEYEYNDMAIRLLSYGADPDVEVDGGLTPFHLACKFNNIELVEYFMRRESANINHLDAEERSVVYHLVQNSDYLVRREDILNDLLSQGVKVSLPDPENITPVIREFLQMEWKIRMISRNHKTTQPR